MPTTAGLKKKPAELLKKIEQGESFSDLAKQYSEDSICKRRW